MQAPLRSAYADVQGAEPCYTSVDPAFPHCIDYVFYNGCGVLRPSRVLGVVDRKQQLPQAPWPSDHLCLVAAFDLTGAGPSAVQVRRPVPLLRPGLLPQLPPSSTDRAPRRPQLVLLGPRASAAPPRLTTVLIVRPPRRRATLYTPQKKTTRKNFVH